MNSPATFAEALAHLRAQGVPEPRLSRLRTITLADRRFVRDEPGFQVLELAEQPEWRLDETDRHWREPLHMIDTRRRERARARKLAA